MINTHALNDNSNKSHSLRFKIWMKYKNIFPYVKAHSVDEYFKLPVEQRQKWGIYLKPIGLPCDLFEDTGQGWNYFDKKIREHYPIQGWFREWFLSIDNPVYWFFVKSNMKYGDIKYSIVRFFKPSHPRFRKAYPRHQWQDLVEAIRNINFALILDFWYEEIKKDIVNWDSDDKHREFRKWIEGAVFWIEKARPQAEKDIDKEYDNIHKNKKHKKLPYDELYGKIDSIEEIIQATDTKILKEMMDYRFYFWT